LGSTVFYIRFTRTGEKTSFEVTKGPANQVSQRSMQDWSRDLTGRS
jgi:hypothetical protein